MSARIYDTDTYKEIAKKIFNDFDIGNSCTITGYVVTDDDSYEKGELVLKELTRLDKVNHFIQAGSKGMQRRRIRLKDSIGGYVEHKIFRYQRLRPDGHLKVVIWRYQ